MMCPLTDGKCQRGKCKEIEIQPYDTCHFMAHFLIIDRLQQTHKKFVPNKRCVKNMNFQESAYIEIPDTDLQVKCT